MSDDTVVRSVPTVPFECKSCGRRWDATILLLSVRGRPVFGYLLKDSECCDAQELVRVEEQL